jgi:quinol monooxygenase YgiN
MKTLIIWITVSALPLAAALAMSNQKLPFGINLRCRVNPLRRDEFLSIVKANQDLTLKEPEALQYIVGQDTTDENCFYIHEQFATPEGFDFHLTTEHNAKWKAFKSSSPEPFEEYQVFKYNVNGSTGKASPRSDTTYGVHVQLCPQPNVVEEFLDVIRNNMKGSNSDIEPLCLQYAFGESLDEQNKFIFHEEYAGDNGGKEGFSLHYRTLSKMGTICRKVG